MVEGDFRMAHRKGMECCRETQTRVSLGLGEGWEGEHSLYPLPSLLHCPVWCEKHVWKDQRDQSGESWSSWEIQTAEAEDIREAVL